MVTLFENDKASDIWGNMKKVLNIGQSINAVDGAKKRSLMMTTTLGENTGGHLYH